MNLSDHLRVFITKKRLSTLAEYDYVVKHSLTNYDIDSFSETLAELDWSIIDLLDDVILAWEMVYKGILREVNRFCPYKEFKVRRNRPPWYNTTLCNLGNYREILQRNYRRTGSRNKDIYSKLVEKKKEFNKEVKWAKKSYYFDHISQCKGDAKYFWKLIGSL